MLRVAVLVAVGLLEAADVESLVDLVASLVVAGWAVVAWVVAERVVAVLAVAVLVVLQAVGLVC